MVLAMVRPHPSCFKYVSVHHCPLIVHILLQVGDKCRIRDRATIMSRHVYADQGDAFADQQVSV